MNELSTLSNNIEFITDNGIQLIGLSNINESLSTHYIVYKIYNLENGKYYIGQHITNDPFDVYMGSGKIIQQALEKYQLSSFIKEILFDFDSFDQMNQKEIELIPLSACYPNNPMSYNLREGGSNGHLSENSKQMIGYKNHLIWINKTDEEKELFRQKCSNNTSGEKNPMYGDYEHTKGLRKHSQNRIGKTIDEIFGKEKANKMRKLYSENMSGEKNPMYGKNPFANKTEEEIRQIKNKEKETKNNRSQEQKRLTSKKIGDASKRSWKDPKRRQKYKETLLNKTPEEKEATLQKRRNTWLNKPEEEKNKIKQKMHNIMSGERNTMRGKKMKDIMGEEKYNLMKKHQRQAIQNRTPEQIANKSQQQKLAISGRKVMYHPNDPSHRISIKPEQWNIYLKQGYVFVDKLFNPNSKIE